MSRPSKNYLDKVERWLLGGVPIQQMVMTPDQRYRAMVCYESYKIWLQNKQIRPLELVARRSQVEYPILLAKAAEGNEEARQYVEAMNIRPGVPRTIDELRNDVVVLNHIIARFDGVDDDIEKAKVKDASDWLIQNGMKTGNDRSVKNGADLKMRLNGDFRQAENAAEALPNPNINITGDVTTIKRDRTNLSPEEMERLRRRFNMSRTEVTDMIQSADGTWQLTSDNADEEEREFDIFDENN